MKQPELAHRPEVFQKGQSLLRGYLVSYDQTPASCTLTVLNFHSGSAMSLSHKIVQKQEETLPGEVASEEMVRR